ncbi:MAG: hypothetical protein ABI905_01110 [Betaproteobacteria bacterium]
MNKTIIASIISLLSASTCVFAADADFLRCRGLTDTAARLACYDAVIVPAPVVGQPARPATSGESRSTISAPPPQLPQAAISQNAPGVSDQFGLENRATPGTVDAIESTIPGKFEGWEAKTNIRLANGQVWQISDDSSKYASMVDGKVRIRRGALGAFYLEFEKINYSPRVKRIQ